MNYTTQTDAARGGIPIKELGKAAEKEKFDTAELMELMAEGRVAIPANKCRQCLETNGIGSTLKTEINANLDTPRDCTDLNMELEKVNDTVRIRAESIMDFSSFGDIHTFRKELTRECPAMIGTAPIYDVMVYYHKLLKDITSRGWIDTVKTYAEGGVDLQTIHIRINRRTTGQFKRAKRLINVVSRGSSIILAWIEMTGQENPFYEHFDEILDICQECNVALNLGDACRPGHIVDASDVPQAEELVALGELMQKAQDKNVQIVIEGPGHMPLSRIEVSMKIRQTVCRGAPFCVLGSLVTDIAPGRGYITTVIGKAPAAASGVPFLCHVTSAEHLGLPDVNDIEEGIIASKIAAHAADIAKGIKGAAQWDHEISTVRKNLDWERMFELSLDPEKARSYRESVKPEKEDTCSMCGNLCTVKGMNRILNGGIISVPDER